MMRQRSVLFATLSVAVLLPACPKCPQGYHRVETSYPGKTLHVEAHDVGRTHRVDALQAVAGNTYVFTVTAGKGTLRDDGPGGKARTRTFGPEGIDGEKAPSGSPVPGVALGSLVVYVGDTPHWIGVKTGDKSPPVTASVDATMTFALDVPPGTPAPGSGLANPNTVDLNFDITVAISRSECVKDGEAPKKKFASLFADYFGPGTAGDCANAGCHGKVGSSAYFGGTDATAMYDWLAGRGKLTSLGDSATSPLKWCNTTSGTMPINSNPAPAKACSDLREWAAQGAAK